MNSIDYHVLLPYRKYKVIGFVSDNDAQKTTLRGKTNCFVTDQEVQRWLDVATETQGQRGGQNSTEQNSQNQMAVGSSKNRNEMGSDLNRRARSRSPPRSRAAAGSSSSSSAKLNNLNSDSNVNLDAGAAGGMGSGMMSSGPGPMGFGQKTNIETDAAKKRSDMSFRKLLTTVEYKLMNLDPFYEANRPSVSDQKENVFVLGLSAKRKSAKKISDATVEQPDLTKDICALFKSL